MNVFRQMRNVNLKKIVNKTQVLGYLLCTRHVEDNEQFVASEPT